MEKCGVESEVLLVVILPHLSPKEKQIVQFLSDGDSLKEAAFKINIGYHTAKTYTYRIRKKFHAQTMYKIIADYCKGWIE